MLQLSASATAARVCPSCMAKMPTCPPSQPAPWAVSVSLAPRGPWHMATCRDEGSKHRSRSSHGRASPGLCLAQHLLAGVEEFRSVQMSGKAD